MGGRKHKELIFDQTQFYLNLKHTSLDKDNLTLTRCVS